MTLKETSEIFGVLMLAYPNAEIFKGGIKKLQPTIELWAQCLDDIDFWTARQATIALCKGSKYPPTVAELRAQAASVVNDVMSKIRECEFALRLWSYEGNLEEQIAALPDGDILALTVQRLGGVDRLLETHEQAGEKFQIWRWSEFEELYTDIVKSKVSPGGNYRYLPMPTGTRCLQEATDEGT